MGVAGLRRTAHLVVNEVLQLVEQVGLAGFCDTAHWGRWWGWCWVCWWGGGCLNNTSREQQILCVCVELSGGCAPSEQYGLLITIITSHSGLKWVCGYTSFLLKFNSFRLIILPFKLLIEITSPI